MRAMPELAFHVICQRVEQALCGKVPRRSTCLEMLTCLEVHVRFIPASKPHMPGAEANYVHRCLLAADSSVSLPRFWALFLTD